MGKEYYKTANKKVVFENNDEVNEAYNEGFVFTRLDKGEMIQTRSLRIDLNKFELNSENRRILNKINGLSSQFLSLPLLNYSWEIHKMGKDFYTQKFGDGTMSASKIKELFQDSSKSNMNAVFSYELRTESHEQAHSTQHIAHGPIGYCLAYSNENILHYAYPFYDLKVAEQMPNLGLGMMLKAILWAKENGKKYFYLGSVVDSSSRYKLQFEGLEWWSGAGWSEDLSELKQLISNE